MKSEFLSTAAHELRTPMASIYGFTELLLSQEFEPGDRQDFLETIFKQSELMVSIINELLDLARIEARRGKDFVMINLVACELTHEIVANFKISAERLPPKEPECHTPCSIRGDRKKLTQAISNVISNAYKYSPAGGAVTVEFVALTPETTTEDVTDALSLLGIRISDQGIGMTPEQLAGVCERFYRADASGKIPGTGLGMSIVKEIVELHGGSLQIESQFGVDTTVTLWLPVASGASDNTVNILPRGAN
jgi:signal transduction histidine kinase